ncbi:recombinase family protein, partial [Amedibacillus dolichus]
MCAYSVFNTFPVYPLSAKPLILLAFCRYRYHTSLFDRPSFQRMIEDIEAGKINCVVTKDLSRLGRNYIMTGQYTELYFPSHNVRYIAIDDGVDSEKGESEIAPFKNIINEWVARDTSR